MQTPDTLQTLEFDDSVVTLDTDEVELVPEHEIPTGEGLTKREARRLVIDEANYLIITKNQKRLRDYQTAVVLWHDKIRQYHISKRDDLPLPKVGNAPKEPTFSRGLGGRRHINQAVCILRRRGGYESLLEAAGY